MKKQTSTSAAKSPVPVGEPLSVTKGSHVYLIDGSGYIFRAYFAMFKAAQSRGKSFTRSDGTPTGAVMTFCNMLWKLVREGIDGERPTHLAVVFDHKGDSFRNALYPAYKANRDAPPDELIPQFPLIRQAVRAFGFTPIEQEGFEADDLIATYACAARRAGASATIVSGDKDLMQLIDSDIRMFDPMPGNERRVGEAEVLAKFGVPPAKVVEVQALAGDSTDNVPGVPGIGIKTAAELINEFGDLEALLARAGEIKQPKRRERLLEFAEQARISRKLVELSCEVPLVLPLDALDLPEIDSQKLVAFCLEMEFRSLTKRVAEAYGIDLATLSADLPPKPRSSDAVNDVEAKPIGVSSGAANTSERSGTPGAAAAWGAKAAIATPIDRSKYETVTTIERLREWVARAEAAGRVAFDTETTSVDPMRAELVGFSLCVVPGEACYVPLIHGAARDQLDFSGGDVGAQAMQRDALDVLKPLMENAAVLKIGQNLKFDSAVLGRFGIALAPIDDTLLLSYVLDGGRGQHGMDAQAERHLGHTCISFDDIIQHAPGTKRADKTFANVPIAKATEYAAEDADVTLRLWMVHRPRLVSESMATVYETLERPLVPVLCAMEGIGIKVDPGILSRLSGQFSQNIARLETKVYEIAGGAFNLGSPKQLGEFLFDRLGLPGGKKTKSGQWETRANLLDELSQREDLPEHARHLINTMLEWRQLSKLKSTYTDALPGFVNPSTGRIHTSYALAATPTGRLSSSDPNLQNIPIRTKEGRAIRTAFVAERGSKLISADYSQIELRVLAHIADIPQLRKAFDDSLDIHAMTASEMFGVPVKDMPPEVRRRAKAINFGIIYGISAFGLANQLSIPRAEASEYIQTYFKRFPGIRDYMEAAKNAARNQGFVETIFGRRIHYPDIKSSNPSMRSYMERAAINAPIQGSAADIIRRAMIRMPDALAKAGLTSARMLLQVHDELVFEAKINEIDAAMAVATRVMEEAPEPVLRLKVPLKVDAKAADNWEAAH
jgi:DNA polymerase-1